MRLLVATMLLFLCACSKKTATPPKIDGALHTQTCGDVTAAWVGDRDDPQLRLHFASGEVLPFRPTGELYPQNKSMDVFSPDCAWALLPQDNFGPYHLVKTSELRAYLGGKATPAEVQAPRADGGTAAVLTDQLWRSPTELEFFASCCGGVEVYRVNVNAPARAERVFFAAEAPSGIRRVDGGYEKAP